MRRSGAPLAALVVALAASLLATEAAPAQELDGTISGEVVIGTAGVALPESLEVELITLTDDGGLTATRTVAQDGRFVFRVAADAMLTYLLRVDYDGASYFADQPLLLSTELPSAEATIAVYEATFESPGLRIESTTVTVVALDRTQSLIALQREDRVLNPSDRTYVGDALGVTLRLPVPDATTDAGGDGDAGKFTFEGGRLAVSIVFPPGITSVVTRYLVGYDRAEDSYRLRVTAPLDSGTIELLVPQSFVGDLRPLGESTQGETRDFEEEQMIVVERTGELRSGESAVAELRELSGRNSPNPLTERSGAIAGAGLALALLVAAFAALCRCSSPHPADSDGDAT
ncbi:MAG TPA: hypothetical protein QGI71_08935 [Dehalococcoidia bacterium]|nr:hypothetical protein [Dehalococcoidia bacterium]